jgi:fumarylacetoacetase-like protein
VRRLTKAGCKNVFGEVASSAKTDRAQVRRLLDQLAPGVRGSMPRLWRPAMYENAEVVLGAPVTDSAVLDLAQMTACLSINVRAIGNGNGGDVMGHPLNALAWLAGKLAAVGTPLRRGMIVMTGSMVPIQYPIAGDRVLVDISGLGTGELAVT